MPVGGASSNICLRPFACFWASNYVNFLCNRRVFSRECYGPQVEIYRPDTAQFVEENIWHSARLCISQTSVGLSYKLLFVRQDPSSITLGGKPSYGRSCHLEADLFSRLTDSAPSLSFCLPSLSVCLYSSISLFYHSNPLLRSLFRSNCSCKHLWFSINFRNSTSHRCLPVCQVFRAPTAGGGASWIHQGHKLIAFTIYIQVWITLPLPSVLPLNTILSILYIQLGCKVENS